MQYHRFLEVYTAPILLGKNGSCMVATVCIVWHLTFSSPFWYFVTSTQTGDQPQTKQIWWTGKMRVLCGTGVRQPKCTRWLRQWVPWYSVFHSCAWFFAGDDNAYERKHSGLVSVLFAREQLVLYLEWIVRQYGEILRSTLPKWETRSMVQGCLSAPIKNVPYPNFSRKDSTLKTIKAWLSFVHPNIVWVKQFPKCVLRIFRGSNKIGTFELQENISPLRSMFRFSFLVVTTVTAFVRTGRRNYYPRFLGRSRTWP